MIEKRMAELFGIDATLIGDSRPEVGTEVKIFGAGDHLEARVDGVPVATVPRAFASRIKAEKEKKCVTGVRVGDVLRISVMVPALRAKYDDSITGSDGTFRLLGGKISYRSAGGDKPVNETRGVAGTQARVESGEELQSRVTATRLLLLGVFAFAVKKKSGGERYLTVEGRDFFWAVEFPHDRTNEAMAFAAKVNAASKEALAGEYEPIEGLARPDGRLHVAVVSARVPEDSRPEGVDVELSALLDAQVSRLSGSGCEVVFVSPMAFLDGVVRLLVTYR